MPSLRAHGLQGGPLSCRQSGVHLWWLSIMMSIFRFMGSAKKARVCSKWRPIRSSRPWLLTAGAGGWAAVRILDGVGGQSLQDTRQLASHPLHDSQPGADANGTPQ